MGDRVTHGNGRPSQPQEESAPTAPNAAGPQRTVQEQSSRMAVTSDASQLLSCRTGEKGGDVGVGGRTSVVGKRDVVPPCATAAPSPDAAPLTGAAEAAGRRKSPLRGAGGGLVERYDRHSTAESSAPIAHSDDRHGEGTAAMGNTGTHAAGRGETPDEGRSGQGRGSRRKRVTRGYQLRIRREHEKQPGTSRRGRGARGPSTHVRALAVLPLPQSTAATTNATATTLNNHNLRPRTRAYIQVVHDGNAFNKKRYSWHSVQLHDSQVVMAASNSWATGTGAASPPVAEDSACTAASTARRTSEKRFHATALPNRRRPPRMTMK